MALVQRDYILRMIQAIAAAIARILKRKEAGDLPGARQEVHVAVAELLGTAAPMVGMLDTRTAANLVSDPKRIALWARLLHEEAELLHLMGRPKDAETMERRILELLLESWRREPEFDEETQRVLGVMRARVPVERLDGGYRAIVVEMERGGR